MTTILHLGLGSFHRAHQALYIHQLRQQGDTRWSITGGNLRPDMLDTMAALQAQGGAYTLETVTPQGERSYTRIESIQRVIPYQPDLRPLIAAGAEPGTRIISFTVTEAGYYLDAKNQPDWASTTCERFSEPTQSRTVISTKPIETSYDTICAAERRAPRKAYLEFEAQPAMMMP